MTAQHINIAIVNYPSTRKSAIESLKELFHKTNYLCEKNNAPQQFNVEFIAPKAIKKTIQIFLHSLLSRLLLKGIII